MRQSVITPQFVELMPNQIQEGVLYISEKYGTAIHKCCCGCGLKVVTPLSPVKWKLQRDGNHVTLYPSIGNWNFPCRSHYWIRRNRVEWAASMTKQQIASVQNRDLRDSQRYIEQVNVRKNTENLSPRPIVQGIRKTEQKSVLNELWNLLKHLWTH